MTLTSYEVLKLVLDYLSEPRSKTEILKHIPRNEDVVRMIIDEVKGYLIIEEDSGMKGGKTYRIPNKLDNISSGKKVIVEKQLELGKVIESNSLIKSENVKEIFEEYKGYDSLNNLNQNKLIERLLILYLRILHEVKFTSAFLENQIDRPFLTYVTKQARKSYRNNLSELDHLISNQKNRTVIEGSIKDYLEHYTTNVIEKMYRQQFNFK